jgi:hypothetical protein
MGHFVKNTFVKLLITGVLLVKTPDLLAQGYYFYNNDTYEPAWVVDGSLNLGLMNCITDVGGSKKSMQGLAATTLRSSNLSAGLSLTATFRDWFAVRVEATTGRISGADSLLKGATYFSAIGRFERNLHFRTSINEIFVGIELHPLTIIFSNSSRPLPRLSPYIVAGIGGLRFNPQANIDNRWVDLKPLRLEGQGFAEYPDRRQYTGNAIIIPFGAGLKFDVSKKVILRAEVLRRTTNSDYLDDVSRGNWVDPILFFNYLSPNNALLASRLYNRSTVINPPRDTRPRGNESNNDVYWNAQVRLGIALNRKGRNEQFGRKTASLKCFRAF